MIGMIKRVFSKTPHEQLPRLENSLTTDYDPQLLTDDELLILLAGVAKGPAEARRLMEEYHVTNAHDLLRSLPKRKVNWRRRFRQWTQSLEGSLNNNPYEELLWPDGSGKNYLD